MAVTWPAEKPAPGAGSGVVVVVVVEGGAVVLGGLVVALPPGGAVVVEGGAAAIAFVVLRAGAAVLAEAVSDGVWVDPDEFLARTAAPSANAVNSRHRTKGTDRADFRVVASARAMRQLSPLRDRGIPSPPVFVRHRGRTMSSGQRRTPID
jgi:hypothetical protein